MTSTPAEGLNAICPYFTMFPLSFPKGILARHAKPGQRVLDPFCGRGTTNFAARLLGLESFGIDSSPVATAITSAKLASSTPEAVMGVVRRILAEVPDAPVPTGAFWELAYHRNVLHVVCRLRAGLLTSCASDVRKLLRGIILGLLHGPLQKTMHGYFSNQCTRTYAPKPAYATRFWRTRRLYPPDVNVKGLIKRRALRMLSAQSPGANGKVLRGDSRDPKVLRAGSADGLFNWIITSPPYYGLRTYVQDQWLRNWFLGGAECVDYAPAAQLSHSSPNDFSEQLRQVWLNAAAVCDDGATLVIRFGGIGDRKANPLRIIKTSLQATDWRVLTIRSAGRADAGKRQANAFLRKRTTPLDEYDVWARLE